MMYSIQLLRTKNRMRSIYGMYFGTIKMMSIRRRSCKLVDDNAKSNDKLDVENVPERVRPPRIAVIQQQKVLCVLQMQKIEWVPLDDTNYNNIEDVHAVSNPEAGTPLFDLTTENIDDLCDS